MSLIATAKRALALMSPEQRAEAEVLLEELSATANAAPDIADFKRRAAATWERDMRPVREAIVKALRDGDMAALRGLRALLPTLLHEVNQQPLLADLLAMQLGQDVLAGMKANPEDVL